MSCLAIAGCKSAPASSASETGDGSAQSQLVTVVMPTRVVNMAHQDIDDVVSDLRTAGAGHYESIEWSGTEGVDHMITITLAEQDKAWWADKSAAYVADVRDQFAAMGEGLGQSGFRIVTSVSYDEIDYYYNLVPDPETQIAPYFDACGYYCIMWQLFTSDESEKWQIRDAVYNSDTGKLVKESFSSDEVLSGGLTYTAEDWERSYEE